MEKPEQTGLIRERGELRVSEEQVGKGCWKRARLEKRGLGSVAIRG